MLTENENLAWSIELFLRFENYWHWGDPNEVYAPDIKSNPHIHWTPDLIKRFEKKMDWEAISQDTELLQEFPQILDDYKDNLHWDYISGNEELVWSEEMIERFADKWHWEYLSGNKAINWTSQIIQKYRFKLDIDRIKSGNDEPWLNKVRPPLVLPKTSLKISGDSKYTKKEFKLVLRQADWSRMSFDERIPWSSSLINKFKNNWYWRELSRNSALPWTEELIDTYFERWEWGHATPGIEGAILENGLSYIPSLPWSIDFIKKYEKYWFWHDLSSNQGIPWSLEYINTFYDKWEWDCLQWNDALWSKVFYPHLNDQVIDELMTEITKTDK